MLVLDLGCSLNSEIIAWLSGRELLSINETPWVNKA